MAWKISTPLAGAQPITTTSATQRHALGTIVTAEDPTYGAGEFIYLLGVASTAAKDWVSFFSSTYQTARLIPDAEGSVAIAMSANGAAAYGWYQIGGYALGATVSAMAGGGVALYISSLPGSPDDLSVAGDLINGAYSITTASAAATYSGVSIQRPWVDNASQLA